MNPFSCLSISPINLSHPGLAIATTRAGGVGVLDYEFCPADQLELAQQNLAQLLTLTPSSGEVGIRLSLDQIHTSRTLLEALHDRPHWVIVSNWHSTNYQQEIASLPAAPRRKLLLEVIHSTDAEAVKHLALPLQGVVVRGHESGGWVGSDSAFILTQKVLNQVSYSVYIQGGIGVHTAAACRAAGVAGVVLDDQLWLMPESPLPDAWKQLLQHLSGQEAIALGERLNQSCRILSRPGFVAAQSLQRLLEQVELSDSQLNDLQVQPQWYQQARSLLGWGEPGQKAWPMGQAVGLAAELHRQYRTTGKLIQAILSTDTSHLQVVQMAAPLCPEGPLAKSHGTRYPIVQGPMTRVSDRAEFAQAVAEAGGLPMLALALMREEQVQPLLQQTQTLLGNRPWGVGILGFVPQTLREAQLRAVQAVRPHFALIAGGRPDQAARLETQGIATYLHVPTSKLLQIFLAQGSRRFVFEGRECGGHVGPLSSFVLWESMIATLLAETTDKTACEIHVLFAGGIHNDLSAAMVSALAAPLVERGIKIGVLMGTAYILTEEASSCGAILPDFQKVALNCQQTINLETAPGHASRCAVTPFVQEFYATRHQLLKRGESPEAIKQGLEDLTLGRLRIASKGLARRADAVLSVEADSRYRQGMYMIGQVATLCNRVQPIAELHKTVSEGSTARLAALSIAAAPKAPVSPVEIAIIGIGTLLPKAHDPETFWTNLLQKVNAIREIPAERWDWRLYYSQNRQERDKIYSKWGGFLDEVPFDPVRFGIPPRSVKSIDPIQLLTLEAVQRALEDTGYANGQFDREHTSVILGASGAASDLGVQYATRAHLPLAVQASETDPMWDRFPEWTEESFPGLLLNVAAGRVANRFDLGGRNFVTDAACASSLGAIALAVEELAAGRSNLVITGGVETGQSPFAYLEFSKTQALSPQGVVRSFDQTADGIVISEGIAVVVLKRLADAERDGDRIYAVIKAVAGSSDGKGLSMTAPRTNGQMRALHRAYDQAGFSANTLELYEAHGTGTVLGDKTELKTWIRCLQENQAVAKSCAIGSVKTLIGHTKSSAGVTGLIKAALALFYRVQPPHAGVETPLEEISHPDSPVYLLEDARPWIAHPNYPRRSAVSAFGFGGTNFHVVLEEYSRAIQPSAPGSRDWPWELFVMRAKTRSDLSNEIHSLLQVLQAGATPNLRDLAYTYAQQAQSRNQYPTCLCLVVPSLEQLSADLTQVLSVLKGDGSTFLPNNVQLADVPTHPGRVAVLFPGQGSQYPNMVREIALYFNELRHSLEAADRQLSTRYDRRLSQFIYPPTAYASSDTEQQRSQLMDTHVAQPSIGAISIGFLDLMLRLGLKPDMFAGHSYGEYTALHAANVLSRSDFLHLSEVRGRVMATACAESEGAMAAVQASREDVLNGLQAVEQVTLANHNAPLQSVISGSKNLVEEVVEKFKRAGVTSRILPVAGAFHSALVESAQITLATHLNTVSFQPPQVPVYANMTGAPYPTDCNAIRTQLSKHLRSPVEFVTQVQAMYADGARIFVELGPKNILTRLVNQILTDDHTAVAVDNQDGLRGFLLTLSTLITRGVALQIPALFQGRDVQALPLTDLLNAVSPRQLAPTAWWLNGGGARPQTEAIATTGTLPFLNQESPMPTIPDSVSVNDSITSIPAAPIPAAAIFATPISTVLMPPNVDSSVPSVNGTIDPISTPSSTSEPTLPPPTIMSTHPTSHDLALSAYQAYQATMQQFLSVQEQVMRQLLQATAYQNGAPTAPTPLLVNTAPPDQPIVVLNQTNGNGSHSSTIPKQSLNGTVSVTSPAPVVESVEPSFSAAPRVEEVVQPPVPTVQIPPIPVVSTPVTPPASVATAPPEVGSSLDREQLMGTLVQIVSNRTGYPTNMLGLDDDLEADLGIDSIKRVEILGGLQSAFPDTLSSQMQSNMEQMTQAKTLNQILDCLLQTAAPTHSVSPVRAISEEPAVGKSSR